MARRRRTPSNVLEMLLAQQGEDDDNVGITTSGMVGAATDHFLSGRTLFPPSHMDAIMGSAVGSEITHRFGAGVLSQPVAQQVLQARIATNKKSQPNLAALSPFDFIAAAAMQRNAEHLNLLLGRDPEFGGVRRPGSRGLERQLDPLPVQPFAVGPAESRPSYFQSIQ